MSIAKIQIKENYTIDIWLDNNENFSYSFQHKIYTARFWELQDKELFLRGTLMGGRVIRWNDMTEITLEELLMEK